MPYPTSFSLHVLALNLIWYRFLQIERRPKHLDDLCSQIGARLHRGEHTQVWRLDTLYRVLASAARRSAEQGPAAGEQLIRQLIDAYFKGELAPAAAGDEASGQGASTAGPEPPTAQQMSTSSDEILVDAPVAAAPEQSSEMQVFEGVQLPIKGSNDIIRSRVRAMLRTERIRLLDLGNKLTGKMVARVFHGLGSPAIRQDQWRRTEWWAKHQGVDFHYIAEVAQREVDAWREAEERSASRSGM